MKHTITPAQIAAADTIAMLIVAGQSPVALTGAAGTGKTSTMKHLAALVPTAVLCAPTWRAAHILREKTGLPTTTLHSATMRPVFRLPLPLLLDYLEAKNYTVPPPAPVRERWPGDWWKTVEGYDAALRNLDVAPMSWVVEWVPKTPQPGVLICDEASMLGTKSLDIAHAVFGSIVLVGDPNQLPPIDDTPVLAAVPPHHTATLTEIHRQADGSAVLEAAYNALGTGRITLPRIDYTLEHACEEIPIVCWRNKTRVQRSLEVRALMDLPPDSVAVGELLICRTTRPYDHARGLTSNSWWRVKGTQGREFLIEGDDGTQLTVEIAMEEFNQQRGIAFRFGYALTCHSAQGGEWPVVAIDAMDAGAMYGRDREQAKQWAYTAITRAGTSAFLVGGVS